MSSKPDNSSTSVGYVDSSTISCPECKADWRGSEIPPEHRKYYAEGVTHGSRLIGLYSIERDMTFEWMCPDCGVHFPRL